MIQELLLKPLWQMTGEEFLRIYIYAMNSKKQEEKTALASTSKKKHEYGIAGIAKIFGCSLPTANRIKKSGLIDGAIRQIGRKIIVDVEKALDLASQKPKKRR